MRPMTRSGMLSPTSGCRSAAWSAAGTGSRSCSGLTRRWPARRLESAVSADAQAAGLPAPQVESGVIHDIGYRRYDAQRLGRAQIVRALTWHSLRSAFGIGRGAKAKIFPVVLFGLICLPAVVNAVALATDPSGGPIVSYDSYTPQIRIVAMLIFVALEAPNLVSSDLRTHSLPLYFARPISRTDYPVAKLAA